MYRRGSGPRRSRGNDRMDRQSFVMSRLADLQNKNGPAEFVEESSSAPVPEKDNAANGTTAKGENGNVCAKVSRKAITKAIIRHAILMRDWRWLFSDVRPYKEYPAKRIINYTVVRVESPNEFYLRYNFEGVQGYATFLQDMQEFYAVVKNQESMRPRPETVIRSRCFVYKDPNDGKWHRVRVHSVKKERECVTVFFLDFGKRQNVPFDSLLDIHPRFSKFSAQVFACYLYDVLPKTDKGLQWSREATEHFRKLVFGKKLSGICQARSDELIKRGLPDHLRYMGMVLFDQKDKKSTINARMVEAGFGEAVGIFAGSGRSFEFPDLLPVFDDNAFRKEFGMELAPVKKIIRKGPLPMDEEDFKVLMDARLELNRPPMSWVPIPLAEEHYLTRKDHHRVSPEKERLPKKLVDHVAYVKMCFLMGPNCIIVHLQSRLNEMQAMQDALKAVAEKEDPVNLDEVEPGDFMACSILPPGAESKVWCRGIVRSANASNQTIKMLLVDYCNEVYAIVAACRKLPPFFQKIPSFAVRCHLDAKHLIPRGQTGWSGDAFTFFRQYVMSWEAQEPIYFMYRSSENPIELKDFNHDVRFDFPTQKWMAGPDKKLNAHKVINTHKDHPMLYSLYRSWGVEIFYEIIVSGSPYWYFYPLHSVLVDNKFADHEKSVKHKGEIHRDIVKLCDFRRVEKMPGEEDRSFYVSVGEHSIKVSPQVITENTQDIPRNSRTNTSNYSEAWHSIMHKTLGKRMENEMVDPGYLEQTQTPDVKRTDAPKRLPEPHTTPIQGRRSEPEEGGMLAWARAAGFIQEKEVKPLIRPSVLQGRANIGTKVSIRPNESASVVSSTTYAFSTPTRADVSASPSDSSSSTSSKGWIPLKPSLLQRRANAGTRESYRPSESGFAVSSTIPSSSSTSTRANVSASPIDSSYTSHMSSTSSEGGMKLKPSLLQRRANAGTKDDDCPSESGSAVSSTTASSTSTGANVRFSPCLTSYSSDPLSTSSKEGMPLKSSLLQRSAHSGRKEGDCPRESGSVLSSTTHASSTSTKDGMPLKSSLVQRRANAGRKESPSTSGSSPWMSSIATGSTEGTSSDSSHSTKYMIGSDSFNHAHIINPRGIIHDLDDIDEETGSETGESEFFSSVEN